MDNKTIDRISKSVERSFPGIQWSQPRVHANQTPHAKSAKHLPTYLLIFSGTAHEAGGRRIPRQVRVVANDKGQILRMSTSR
ncbi:MAG: hypothetical protein HYZ26_11730 [Chloroflexi bacterium]|nr:hypothetical protein [Chloroflexota bacterium]